MANKFIIDLGEDEERTGLLGNGGLARLGALGWSIGLGASLMYLLDPELGRRRRALIRDGADHAVHVTRNALRKAGVDVRNRMLGRAVDARHRLERERVPDDVLVERVRSAMGRFVSHPGAIEVRADHGRVHLQGPILSREAPLMLRRLRRVRGVRDIVDQLDRHDTADAVPALQGSGTLQFRRTWQRENWTPALRVVGCSAGMGLTGYGLQQRGVARVALSGAGVILTLRALTNLPVKRLVGISAGYRAIDIQKDIHIHAPVEEVFEFVRNFENLPRFMSHLRKVSVHGDRSHWEAAGPAGVPVHWDMEVTELEPNRRIAWKSIAGSQVKNTGVMLFEPKKDGTTRIDIRVAYNPPAGAIGHAVAHMFGADPKQAMDDDLMRLKSLLEIGKVSAHGRQISRNELGGSAS